MKPGDLVIYNLTKIAKENNIQSGWISGIGAIKNATIGMYDLKTKEYVNTSPDIHVYVPSRLII